MEIVDQEIERVLPAFRAAVHCELLTQDEVKQIIIKRKKDEAKLIKRRVDLTDYINFLHQDNMILKLIGKRRKATNYSHKMDEIEFQLVARLSRVMKRAQRLWPDNMSVWATHIALCEQWNKRTQVKNKKKRYKKFSVSQNAPFQFSNLAPKKFLVVKTL